jgi:hypothetical protein
MKTDSFKMFECNARVQLCREQGILIDRQTFKPDRATAYVDFELSHAFPVVTIDGTALHPQVVANSYRNMFSKVFDLNHLMKKYDPKATTHDHMLGTIMAVEFPSSNWNGRKPEPGESWTVQGERELSPGIRAVACMHRAAQGVDDILRTQFNGDIQWTVSMEQQYQLPNSGFVVQARRGNDPLKQWDESTPEDLKALGWTYVPCVEAPEELLDCFDDDSGAARIRKKYRGAETIILFGGLNGTVDYIGVGLTPMGKEEEANVRLMLAGKKMIEVNGVMLPDVVGLLERTAKIPELKIEN